jgi:GntR family transcriptional regulator
MVPHYSCPVTMPPDEQQSAPIESESGREIRDAVERGIRELIATAQSEDQERLPTERELAERFGVSRATIRQVLDALEHSGLVRRRRGRTGGTFVTQNRVNLDFGYLAGIPSYLRAQGFRAGAHVVSARVVPADARIAEALQIQLSDPVHDIVRVRLADEVPISLEHARFPVALFPDLLAQPLTDSMYDVLSTKYGHTATRAVERLTAVLADASQAGVLGIRVGDPMIAIERITYDQTERPLEFSNDLFRGDRTRVTAWAYHSQDPPSANGGAKPTTRRADGLQATVTP